MGWGCLSLILLLLFVSFMFSLSHSPGIFFGLALMWFGGIYGHDTLKELWREERLSWWKWGVLVISLLAFSAGGYLLIKV